MICLRFYAKVLFSLVSVCRGCEGKSGGGEGGLGAVVPVTVIHRRLYAFTVVTDSILCVVAAIWRGCGNFQSVT